MGAFEAPTRHTRRRTVYHHVVMQSYVRQGEIGCPTLLRMMYVLILYVVVGGFHAIIPFIIILVEAGGVDEIYPQA